MKEELKEVDRSIAKEALVRGFSLENIVKLTGLSRQEIEKLRLINEEERLKRKAERWYELRQRMAIMDYKTQMQSALEDGIEEGREEGRKESKKEVAKVALAMGLSLESIAKMTGLSLQEIEELNDTKERTDS